MIFKRKKWLFFGKQKPEVHIFRYWKKNPGGNGGSTPDRTTAHAQIPLGLATDSEVEPVPVTFLNQPFDQSPYTLPTEIIGLMWRKGFKEYTGSRQGFHKILSKLFLKIASAKF